MSLFSYMIENKEQIIELFIEHINLTVVAVFLAILIGVPLGIFISYFSKTSKIVIGIANIIQAVPSMALLGFMIPIFGIGVLPATVAVILYSLLPIVKNTFTGIHNINSQTLEAAKGIGLTPMQVLTKVQIPLALPVIMTGIRVTSVTAVGLMTIASFIGAGGLGYLVFSGISTVNAEQILAGAIPACLLALTVDFTLGILEKLVTPISLQKGNRETKEKNRKKQKMILSVILAVVVFLVGTTAIGTASLNNSGGTITIASKDFTEQKVIANMVSELIEHKTDIKVDRKFGLGGTHICFTAIKNGDVDMYIEYTGTAKMSLLKDKNIDWNNGTVYDLVKENLKKEYDVETLNRLGFNNSYALAVTKKVSEKYNIKTISDLAKVADKLRFAVGTEFNERKDGLQPLKELYNFTEKSKKVLASSSLKYVAIDNDEADVIDAFATDGLLKKFDLIRLVDDKKFFSPYDAVPIIESKTLKKYPELEKIIGVLGNVLNDDVMTELNYRVDENKENPKNVALDFLKTNGLI